MTAFATILADPPWKTKSGTLRGRKGFVDSYGGKNAPLPYPTMTVAEICALPVSGIAAEDAHLYLWTTNRYLLEAREVIRAWGFRYGTTLVWAKNPIGGGLGEPFGISTEFLLFARRGKLRHRERVTGTWFNWKRRTHLKNGHTTPKHSAKPLDSYALIERVSPGPYVELFSRETSPRQDWSYWGNESLNTAEMAGVA